MLRRGLKVQLKHVGDNQFDVMDMRGNKLLASYNNYFIYMQDVEFVDGMIIGTYLGNASDSLIDDYCRDIDFSGANFYIELDVVKNARMVAVNSANKKIIKIQ